MGPRPASVDVDTALTTLHSLDRPLSSYCDKRTLCLYNKHSVASYPPPPQKKITTILARYGLGPRSFLIAFSLSTYRLLSEWTNYLQWIQAFLYQWIKIGCQGLSIKRENDNEYQASSGKETVKVWRASCNSIKSFLCPDLQFFRKSYGICKLIFFFRIFKTQELISVLSQLLLSRQDNFFLVRVVMISAGIWNKVSTQVFNTVTQFSTK